MFRRKKKKKEELFANHHKLKEGTFHFNSIRQYFLLQDKNVALQAISDKTYEDLDMDEVFMYIDRTTSKVGQQFLYHSFRTIPSDKSRCEQSERLISLFKEDIELKNATLVQLSRLTDFDAYAIASLFLENHSPKPRWFWVIVLLSTLSVCSIFLAFFIPEFLLLLLAILSINYFIHYWNRENFIQYSGSIRQLLILKQVAQECIKKERLFSRPVKESIRIIDRMGYKMSFFKLDASLQSDIGQLAESLFDILKALLLIEPILFFNVLKEIDLNRKEIHSLYRFVGEIDVALSIDSLRKTLPYYSLPTLSNKRKELSAQDIYHPLLPDFVANSIENHQKSILLTGSNMSGKTTFIRTVGINAILAQTLNTCCAKAFNLPRLKVHSAIRISDDMMSDKSYYFEEVLTIKHMLKESRSGTHNLFLLDEMFKGTNTIERIAAGKAILSYLCQENNIVFISTHDLELAAYLKDSYKLYHFTEVVENDSILFDYKIKAGPIKTTNAIRILELNHYPAEVIEDARTLSDKIDLHKVSLKKETTS